jgi:hypothetical protein
MTKIELHFKLTRRIDDEKLMDAVSRIHGVYGFVRATLAPTLDALTIEYDASRLNAQEVEDWLHRFGLPVQLASEFAG